MLIIDFTLIINIHCMVKKITTLEKAPIWRISCPSNVFLWTVGVFLHFLENKLVVVTVASNATDGYLRFLRSAEVYGYSVEVIIFPSKQRLFSSRRGTDRMVGGGGQHGGGRLKLSRQSGPTPFVSCLSLMIVYDTSLVRHRSPGRLLFMLLSPIPSLSFEINIIYD